VASLILFVISWVFIVRIVPEGNVGVRTTWGKAEDGVHYPGVTAIFPFAQAIVPIETRIQRLDFKDIDTGTKNLQSVKAIGSINYHVDPTRAVELYRELGPGFEDRVVQSALVSYFKEITPEYSYEELVKGRAAVREKVVKALNENLNVRYGTIVDDLYIENFAPTSTEFSDSIEKVQVAIQNAKAAEEDVKRVIQEARPRLRSSEHAARPRPTASERPASPSS
jgi:prohibitin 2